MEKKFECPKCGHKYLNSDNFTSCPHCFGLGKPDNSCTCSHYRIGFGFVRTGVIAKKDPKCPVHGEGKK